MDPPIVRMSEDRHDKMIKIMHSEVNADNCMQQLTHMSKNEQAQLALVLKQCPFLCKGETGTLKIPPVHFEMKEGTVPHHAKPFQHPKHTNT